MNSFGACINLSTFFYLSWSLDTFDWTILSFHNATPTIMMSQTNLIQCRFNIMCEGWNNISLLIIFSIIIYHCK